MKHFFFLLLILFVNVLGAQEQITNIVGNGTTENYVFQEYMDKKYMLSFDKFDNVTTYEMTDESLELMHTRKIDGGKEVRIGKTNGKFLLLENGSASIAYNFVDDEVKYFEYENGVVKGSWDVRFAEDQVMLYHSFGLNHGSKSYYINLKTEVIDTLKRKISVLGMTEELIWGRSLSADSVSFDLVSYNKFSKDYQTVFTFPQVTKRYHYINGIIIYDDLSKTYAYNTETGENSLVYEHLKEFRSFNIFEIGDHIALAFTNKASSQSGPYDLKLISLNDFSIQSIPVDDAVIDIYPSLIQGKIIYEESGKTIIHDLSTNEKVTFKTYTTSQYYIADDKYLVHLDFDTLRVVNIFSKKEMPHSVPITFKTLFFSIKAIKINDKYIFNIYNNNENDKKLFQVDLKNQTVSNYEFEPYAPTGLFSKSNIALNDSTLLLFDEDIYHVKGKEYTQLNTGLGEVLKYRIIEGFLYWIQDNLNNLEVYQFSESVVSKVGDIPKSELMQSDLFNFKDFGVIDGDIYFIEGYYDATLNRIKKGSTVVKRIDYVDAPTSAYQIMIHKGNLYYAKGETVRVILQDETIYNTFLSVDPASPFEKIILNDKMFYVNDKAIVHIDGKDFSIITEMDVRGGLNFPIKKINDSHILILKADKTYDIFDGVALKKSTLLENVTINLIVSEKYIIASKLETTEVYKSYLYDFNQNMSVALPDSISSLILIKVFNYFGKNIFVAKDGKDPFSKLVFYEMSDDFLTYQLIKSIDVIGSNLKFNFEQYQNEGLIYVGDKIYIMDENLNMTQLEDISGDPSQNKIILHEGYFYFIALHPLHGRQLFRIQPISLRTSTDPAISNTKKLNIHPNPASQEIFFEGDLFSIAEIYNMNGNLIKQSTLDDGNRLGINGLLNGTYVVILTDKSGQKSVGKFIKID